MSETLSIRTARRFTAPSRLLLISVSALLFHVQLPAQQKSPNRLVGPLDPFISKTRASDQAAATGSSGSLKLTSEASAEAASLKFIEFNVPGAGSGENQGTTAVAINNGGDVTGTYNDAQNIFHGFVRFTSGNFTTFDLPAGDGTAYQGPVSLNRFGAITGNYVDMAGALHGFVRSPEGSIFAFDAPGAGTEANQGTSPQFINDRGEIVGYLTDSTGFHSAFLRTPNGSFHLFQAPGAGTAAPEGTAAHGINNSGEITGDYLDASDVLHAFVRAADGTFTSFDTPGYDNTYGLAIDSTGAVTGYGFSNETGLTVGIYRSSDGVVDTFAPFLFGEGISINDSGTIAGFSFDANSVYHGFRRSTDGTILAFEAPDASQAQYYGTLAFGINNSGAVVGEFLNSQNVYYGFILLP